MRIRGLTLACLIAAGICSAASAAESNPLESAVYWRMAFGAPHQPPVLGYGFALRHDSDSARVVPALLQFEVSQSGALTRVAGIPVGAQAFKLDQTDEEAALETEPAARTPWYARQWVWWTGAGLAATAAVLSSGDPDENNQNTFNNGSGNDNGRTVGIGCVNGQCAVSCHGDLTNPDPSTCGSELGFAGRNTALSPRERDDLDGGNGQMGDLTER